MVKYFSILCIAASKEAFTKSFGGSKVVVGVAIVRGMAFLSVEKVTVARLTVEVCGATFVQSLHSTLAPLQESAEITA